MYGIGLYVYRIQNMRGVLDKLARVAAGLQARQKDQFRLREVLGYSHARGPGGPLLHVSV